MVNNLFEILTPIAVDEAIADKAGEYLRKYSKGHDLNIGDAIIAATSREMALKLITRNVKHYPMKDIEVVRPYELFFKTSKNECRPRLSSTAIGEGIGATCVCTTHGSAGGLSSAYLIIFFQYKQMENARNS